jgi:hypothetical protein
MAVGDGEPVGDPEEAAVPVDRAVTAPLAATAADPGVAGAADRNVPPLDAADPAPVAARGGPSELRTLSRLVSESLASAERLARATRRREVATTPDRP